jgi:hypothetical protein
VTVIGAASLIEMIYTCSSTRRWAPRCHSWEPSWTPVLLPPGRGDCGAVVGLGLFEGVRRPTARRWGRIQEAIEESIKKGRLNHVQHRHPSTGCASGAAVRHALELRDLRKSFGKTEIIRGANLAVNAGERVAIIGPNGAGKSTLFNLISGRFEPSSGEVLLHGQRIDGEALRDQPHGAVAQLPDHQHLSQAFGVRELRCSVLWSLGYRYSFWRFSPICMTPTNAPTS